MSFFSLGIPPSLDDHTSKINIVVLMRPTLTQVNNNSGPDGEAIPRGIGPAARGPVTGNWRARMVGEEIRTERWSPNQFRGAMRLNVERKTIASLRSSPINFYERS